MATLADGYVIGATPFAVQSSRLAGVAFDTVIFDEASQITLEEVVLRHSLPIHTPLTAQMRYRQPPFAVSIATQEAGRLTLHIDTEVQRPAAGQSCVLYNGSHCLGGGIITS